LEALPENSIDEFFNEKNVQDRKNEELFNKNNILLHKVFVQNKDGAELLAKWRDSLIMIPTLESESTQFGAGMNEGEKRFIRNLIASMKTAEQDNE
jgi:hypothetical protein